MSIFPFLSSVDVDDYVNNSNTELEIYREVAWDYENDTPIIENGEFKIIEGKEAIKVWIYKAIKTVRYKHSIYSWNYGCEVENLIGQGYTQGYTKSEAERYIKECLLINPYITGVKITDISFSNDILECNVNVNTIYGEVSVDV